MRANRYRGNEGAMCASVIGVAIAECGREQPAMSPCVTGEVWCIMRMSRWVWVGGGWIDDGFELSLQAFHHVLSKNIRKHQMKRYSILQK